VAEKVKEIKKDTEQITVKAVTKITSVAETIDSVLNPPTTKVQTTPVITTPAPTPTSQEMIHLGDVILGSAAIVVGGLIMAEGFVGVVGGILTSETGIGAAGIPAGLAEMWVGANIMSDGDWLINLGTGSSLPTLPGLPGTGH
jgi:hypothetical protein